MTTARPQIAIIGAGFAGLGMAMRLKHAGITSFAIYEKGDRLGGTWRDNTYPGAACDIPSHLYCYSFEPNPGWSRKYAEQPEILEYLERCADRYGLRPHIRCRTEVVAATYLDAHDQWCLQFSDGEEVVADVVVAATGQLNRPLIPDIPGLDRFTGAMFHSARWDHDHDLAGRAVAVVGTGASAVQFVPHVAASARHVTVFQRSPGYVAPKADREFSEWERRLFTRLPSVDRLYRWWLYVTHEPRWLAFRHGGRVSRRLRRAFVEQLSPIVSDSLPAAAIIPEDPVGCKRILISSDYYATLMRDSVEVVTSPIAGVEEHAIVTANGERHDADTIILGTGFEATRFLGSMTVLGSEGRSLAHTWAAGPEAHLGMTVAGFPNFFLLYGPNTNLGHNSILIMVERQIAYVMRCLDLLASEGADVLDVRRAVMARYNQRLQDAIGRTVWAAGCRSWYKTATGRVTQNWPGTTIEYWWVTRRVRRGDFVARARRGVASQPLRSGAQIRS